ncbi:MAG: lipid A phosphate methyltransferase [Sphingobacteriaceae bacterium]|nr:lipid A phosphate methyltransferase [Sphingobacteriaceae bacterium]
MPLREELEANGNWLFVRRSWLPILLYPVAVAVLYFYLDAAYPKITDLVWCVICLVVSLLGLVIRAITIGFVPLGTSGRNTDGGQVAEVLNQKGIYSTVRHPLYLGNFLMWLGLFMYLSIWWFVVICSLAYWIYYERIMIAEEEFLRKKYGSTYELWASKTPAFIPDFSLWKSADLSFSVKNVLKREYNGLLAVAVTFSIFNVTAHYFYDEAFKLDCFWQVVLIISSILFITLRTLKRHTRVLHVEGR